MAVLERFLAFILLTLSLIGILLSIQHPLLQSSKPLPVSSLQSQAYCPPCPPPTNWTSCQEAVGSMQEKTLYLCTPSTGYHCTNITITRPCMPGKPVTYTIPWNTTRLTFSTIIPDAILTSYQRKPRLPTSDYSYYATDPADASSLQPLIHQAEAYARILHTQPEFLLTRLVQSLPYTPDAYAGADEYPQYPLETLARGAGDCEDTAILLGRLLTLLGRNASLIRLPEHMAIAIPCPPSVTPSYEWQGEAYCYVETTDPWPIGRIPAAYQQEQAEFLPLTPKPFIMLDWYANVSRSEEVTRITTHVLIMNNGTRDAHNLTVHVMLDATLDDRVYNQTQRSIPRLPPGMTREETVTLTLPRGVRTRIHILLTARDTPWKEAVSSWFTS